ncbi:HesB/IscA family protein [Agaribacterium haliotis]|uniref:HesB/IscA family protein n=1 Tax=Agaribacterium haliotis TaxID=2013869 RepID=UPI000BB59BE2|nr:iron-sulfur cluster assembly accessory protein [Agaribacterium haliotis]
MSVENFEFQQADVVHVTAAAQQHFAKQLARSGKSAIRLSLKQAGCTGYKYQIDEVDQAEQGDLNSSLANGVEFYIDSQYLSAIQGTEIDVRQQGLNLNLVMQNPNVKDECGCGESFNIEAKVEGEN